MTKQRENGSTNGITQSRNLLKAAWHCTCSEDTVSEFDLLGLLIYHSVWKGEGGEVTYVTYYILHTTQKCYPTRDPWAVHVRSYISGSRVWLFSSKANRPHIVKKFPVI